MSFYLFRIAIQTMPLCDMITINKTYVKTGL